MITYPLRKFVVFRGQAYVGRLIERPTDDDYHHHDLLPQAKFLGIDQGLVAGWLIGGGATLAVETYPSLATPEVATSVELPLAHWAQEAGFALRPS
jgi:hypothetical protein